MVKFNTIIGLLFFSLSTVKMALVTNSFILFWIETILNLQKEIRKQKKKTIKQNFLWLANKLNLMNLCLIKVQRCIFSRLIAIYQNLRVEKINLHVFHLKSKLFNWLQTNYVVRNKLFFVPLVWCFFFTAYGFCITSRYFWEHIIFWIF